jgi:hypothetical protein
VAIHKKFVPELNRKDSKQMRSTVALSDSVLFQQIVDSRRVKIPSFAQVGLGKHFHCHTFLNFLFSGE